MRIVQACKNHHPLSTDKRVFCFRTLKFLLSNEVSFMQHRFDVVYELYGSRGGTGWDLRIRGDLDEDPADAVQILQQASRQLGVRQPQQENKE